MRAKHEKTSLKTPGLEQEMEEKLAGVFEAQGNKAGGQGLSSWEQKRKKASHPTPHGRTVTSCPHWLQTERFLRCRTLGLPLGQS